MLVELLVNMKKRSLLPITKFVSYKLLSNMDIANEGSSNTDNINHALVIQKEKGKAINDEWIIDNGASNHMISNPKLFNEYNLWA